MLVAFLRWGIPLVILVTSIGVSFMHQRRLQNAHQYTEISKVCEICQRPLNEEKKTKLGCNHSFHSQCITMVFENQDQLACPIRQCRKIFSSYYAAVQEQ